MGVVLTLLFAFQTGMAIKSAIYGPPVGVVVSGAFAALCLGGLITTRS